MRNSILQFIFCGSIILISQLSAAQQDLGIDQIEVVKDFEVRLAEAEKLTLQPQLPTIDTSARSFQYDVTVADPAIQYPAPVLRPLAMQKPGQDQEYRAFLRAGGGAPNNLLGELSYQLISNRNATLAGSFAHRSANRKNYAYQKFHSNDFQLKGSWQAPSRLMVVDGKVRYRHDDDYYYGFDHEDESVILEYDDFLHNLKRFDLSAGVRSPGQLESGLRYSASIEYGHLQNNANVAEDNVLLNLSGSKQLGSKCILGLQILTDFTSYASEEGSQELNNFYFKPSIKFGNERYSLSAIIAAASHADEYFFLPSVEGSLSILQNQMILFGGVDAGWKKNNFASLIAYNPWIRPTIDSIRNTGYWQYFAGLKGKVSFLDYEGKLSYQDNDEIPLYLLSEDDTRMFEILYDDVDILRLEAAISGQFSRDIRVGGSLVKNIYDPAVQERAWHLPSFEASIFAGYEALAGRLQVRSRLTLATGVAVVGDDQEPERLNNLIDLSLKGDYFISDQIGAFLMINNLLGTRYERWQNYPGFGAQIIIGGFLRI